MLGSQVLKEIQVKQDNLALLEERDLRVILDLLDLSGRMEMLDRMEHEDFPE